MITMTNFFPPSYSEFFASFSFDFFNDCFFFLLSQPSFRIFNLSFLLPLVTSCFLSYLPLFLPSFTTFLASCFSFPLHFFLPLFPTSFFLPLLSYFLLSFHLSFLSSCLLSQPSLLLTFLSPFIPFFPSSPTFRLFLP